jgi:hypothetical protein
MWLMNKDLPNNIDNFFTSHLKDYVEDPGDNIWMAIDEKLSEKEKKNKIFNRNKVLNAAAILVCVIIPFSLSKLSLPQQSISKKSVNQQINNPNQTKKIAEKNYSNLNANTIVHQDVSLIRQEGSNTLNNPRVRYNVSNADYYISPINDFSFLNQIVYPQNNHPSKNICQQLQFNNIATSNQTSQSELSTTISLHSYKHSWELVPFFSADHISGRFIEQYEYDHADKSDYVKREKPDASFTGGLLVSKIINKKFSLTSGVSFSNSSVTISSTAVNALQDASGVYKFKLATSYGFAEISKTGIMPNAGDSLLISGATMQLNYISFPLLAKYNIGDKKIKWSMHAGIALNKITTEKVQVEYSLNNNDDNETVNKIEGVKPIFFTLNTGVEAKYRLNPHIDIGFGPELRYGINSINKGTPIKTYPINYGIALNVHIKL